MSFNILLLEISAEYTTIIYILQNVYLRTLPRLMNVEIMVYFITVKQ